MGLSIPPSTVGGGASAPQRIRRRRSPSAAETARRRAWAAEWANVGREWKRNQLAKGAR